MPVDAVLIAGPTASGKSAIALELAERLNGVIINTDSMQVYRELRVLTARPSPDDEKRAPHRLYGHVSARERYSAGRYQEDAAGALAEARQRGSLPIFVGGTGLYFLVLCEGLSPIPPIPADIRKQVRKRFEELGRDVFFAQLAKADPVSTAKLRIGDTQRLLRAADVLAATGKPLSAWQETGGDAVLTGFSPARFVLAPPREVLSTRIALRLESMIGRGALEEAEVLLALDPDLPAARALGVREFGRHIRGEIPLGSAIDEVQRATMHYVKRQMTWFRQRMQGWTWLEHEEVDNFVAAITNNIS